jgi:hypothetical protein
LFVSTILYSGLLIKNSSKPSSDDDDDDDFSVLDSEELVAWLSENELSKLLLEPDSEIGESGR